METILNFLMSTNGLIIIGILWYLVQHFLGVKSKNKSKLEKWLMSQIVGSIAEQETRRSTVAVPVAEKEPRKVINKMLRESAISNIMTVVSATNKKAALKKIGIDLTYKAAGMAIDRIIKSSKMGIKLKLRDLPFLKKLLN